MLCTIPSYLVGDARRILTMLCFATRPLKVRELIDAVAVDIKEPMGLRKDRRMQDYNDIHDICPGFIELGTYVDEADDFEEADPPSSTDYVQIAHFSVQEYLVSERIRKHKAVVFGLDSATANAEIAQVCLVYLLEDDLATLIRDKYTPISVAKSVDEEEEGLDSDMESLSAEESVDGGLESLAGDAESVDEDGIGLNRDEDNLARETQNSEGVEENLHEEKEEFDGRKEIHDEDKERLDKGEGAGFTLDDLLDKYPLAKFAAESWPQQCRNMTEYSMEVHCLISKLLLQNGKVINWPRLHDWTTHEAGRLDHVVRLFGVAANPVYYASLLGLHNVLQKWFDGWRMQSHDDQVELSDTMPKLLEMINAKGGYYGYPLVAASTFGHLKTAQLLLNKRANIDACESSGTALYAASLE